MPNKGYEKGRRAEWKVRDWLKQSGYSVVRAAGSRGPIDLVAWRGGEFALELILVQVKATATRPTIQGSDVDPYYGRVAWVRKGEIEWL